MSAIGEAEKIHAVARRLITTMGAENGNLVIAPQD
jgi:hypothetical protein